MKQIRLVILLTATLMLMCACPKIDEGHRFITFVNKSDKEIASQHVFSGAITRTDTLFFCRIAADGIKPNTQFIYECPIRTNGWEKSLKSIPFLQFSVMDAETYINYIAEPCDTIRKYVPLLHIYQLTLEDLQKMNWTIVYPPEE